MQPVGICHNEPLRLMAPENVKDRKLRHAADDQQSVYNCHINQEPIKKSWYREVNQKDEKTYLLKEFRLSRLSPANVNKVRTLPIIPPIPTVKRATPETQ